MDGVLFQNRYQHIVAIQDNFVTNTEIAWSIINVKGAEDSSNDEIDL